MTQTIAGVDYLDVDEAAGLLGVKKATLYAYVSRGRLRSYRQGIGRKRLYRRADIEALRAVRPSEDASSAADERIARDVELPDAESWASDH
jgi:excisionase family DNA binding protein